VRGVSDRHLLELVVQAFALGLCLHLLRPGDHHHPQAPGNVPVPEEMRRLAVAAFRAISASGFARVDFFIEKGTNRVFVNEINTIPGFTNISMYPKLWEATEVKYSRLIERLVELGLERHKARAARRDSAMEWLRQARKIT